MIPTLFAATLFASAALLFAAQPLAGKELLPLAGGTPAVWTTCLVFFQGLLLLGYLYADRLTSRPGVGRQVAVHLAVAAAAGGVVLALRPDAGWIPDDDDYPVGGLLLYLAALIGGPFFALSATAPLVQKWFAAGGREPYVLYAASNAGSFVGLLAYPFAVEPFLPLGDQKVWWVVGYAGVVGLVGACGFAAARRSKGSGVTVPRVEVLPTDPGSAWRWVALAALPSSLLMSVTAHLTTDVAPVPLFWVVPLAVYLLTFVVAFGHWPTSARRVVGRAEPMLLVFVALALLTRATEPPAAVAAVHLLGFAAAALLCHGELAASRPPAAGLTRFYLALSLGGVLGGLFNAVVAPVLFSRVGLAEYPLGLVLVALVRPRRVGGDGGFPTRDVAWVGLFAVLTVGSVVGVPLVVPADPADNPAVAAVTRLGRLADPDFRFGRNPDDPVVELVLRLVRSGLMYGIPAAAAFALVRRPVRFALCLGVLFLAGGLDPGLYGTRLHLTRNFFGTLRVTRVDVLQADGPPRPMTRLVHGTTLHGQQWADEPGPPRPLMYYHRTGPAGRLLARLPDGRTRRVAAVGLGCGALAGYSRPGERWTFYEIDPAVARIAADPTYFTFLRDAPGTVDVILGDARRRLAREPDGEFGLIVLDAFSSDAIPVHLLTTEAIALYQRKLAAGGVLLFHLSNRYLDLSPLVARLGAAAEPPLGCRVCEDSPTAGQKADGKLPSAWAVLSRDDADLGAAAKDGFWSIARPRPGPVWRDDFSDLLAVWKREEK